MCKNAYKDFSFQSYFTVTYSTFKSKYFLYNILKGVSLNFYIKIFFISPLTHSSHLISSCYLKKNHKKWCHFLSKLYDHCHIYYWKTLELLTIISAFNVMHCGMRQRYLILFHSKRTWSPKNFSSNQVRKCQ